MVKPYLCAHSPEVLFSGDDHAMLDIPPASDLAAWDIHCAWGREGIDALAPVSDVIILVDVLVFSSCVEIATQRGARIYPYGRRDTATQSYATAHAALLAHPDRRSGAYALSPTSLLAIPAGTQLVLPSSNGGALSLATGTTPTIAGCLRNARAVAAAAQTIGQRISVIAAGAYWPDDRARPAIEDVLGAGAIIAHLTGTRSPQAMVAQNTFLSRRSDLERVLHSCLSGQIVIEKGCADDIPLAAMENVSPCVPVLDHNVYITLSEWYRG